MILCEKCNKETEYSGRICRCCGEPISLSSEKFRELRALLTRASEQKQTSDIYRYRKILADFGGAGDMREYAKLLEKGDHLLRDMDAAMEYYKLAAECDDAYSAYRYSKLAGRHSEAARSFWLKYSALLGLGESYGELAELLDDEGDHATASYYAYLAAESGESDAIVNMARRYNDGIGVPSSPEHAKWYLDKLTIPPISAIKLAYKLRSVHKEQPPTPTFPREEAYLKALSDSAVRLSADAAYFRLNSMLADLGNVNSMAIVGVLLSEGKGAKKDIDGAVKMLNAAYARGNAAAAVYLANCYSEGGALEYSPTLAIEYYKKAAALGYLAAYERLGDIYREGVLAEKNIKLAVEYYEAGAALDSSRIKADELKAKRREFFDRGSEILKMRAPTPAQAHEAFRSLAIATAMGEENASLLLADCYMHGFGTKRDPSYAFYWYKTAYDEGNASALLPMALCYARGEGVAFSYKNAVRYLSVAQERGSSAAASELDKLFRRRMKKMIRQVYSQAMSLIYMRKYEEAFRVLLSAAPLGYPKALYTLGCLYEFGSGTKRSDKISAAKYYDMALSGNENFPRFVDHMSKYKLKILKMIR